MLTLNDLKPTLDMPLTEIPRGSGRDEDYDMDLIREMSKKNREIGYKLLTEFRERMKAEADNQGCAE